MTEDAIDRIVQEWNRERPDLDVSPTHVLQRITRLYLLQSASFAEVFGRYGLSFGEYEVLAALTPTIDAGPSSPSRRGGVRSSTTRSSPIWRTRSDSSVGSPQASAGALPACCASCSRPSPS